MPGPKFIIYDEATDIPEAVWDTPPCFPIKWYEFPHWRYAGEVYNGPEWPTYRMYVHRQSPGTAGRRVQLVVFESPDDLDGTTVGYYPDPPTAREARRQHMEFGWPYPQP